MFHSIIIPNIRRLGKVKTGSYLGILWTETGYTPRGGTTALLVLKRTKWDGLRSRTRLLLYRWGHTEEPKDLILLFCRGWLGGHLDRQMMTRALRPRLDEARGILIHDFQMVVRF